MQIVAYKDLFYLKYYMPKKTPQPAIIQQLSADIITRQIIPSAILAPSAHNTQPWKFKALSNILDIYIDWSRHLTISDPNLRQLYVSLGCATTNAILAARYWNKTTQVQYFPEGEEKDKPVVRLTFTPVASPVEHNQADADMFTAINERHTNRSFFNEQPLTDEEITALSRQTDPSITSFIFGRNQLEQIAQISQEGTFSTLSRKEFKEELSHWVRNSWTYQHDGMPGYAMGIPAPLSLVAPIIVRIAPIHIQEAPKTKQQVTSSSTVAIFSTAADTPSDHIRAGQQLEQVWLNATAAGLDAMPIVAAIEAGADFRQKLKDIAGIKQYPQSLLRIGHSTKTHLRATPRRTLAECLK